MRVPFIDRDAEVQYLLGLAGRGSVFPLFIYGPEGCGKTRLIEEVRDRLKQQDFAVIYIDAKEHDLDRALRGSSSEFFDIATSFISAIEHPLGKALTSALSKVITLYERRYRFRGKRVVLLIDEVVEGVGLQNVERYAKILYDLANDLITRFDAESVCIVATTSEGMSRELLSKHSYLHLSYLWNLDRDAFERLAKELNIPQNPGVDKLYSYTSGNPRALIDIAMHGWNIDEWLEMMFRERILPLRYERIVTERIDELERVVEDPDQVLYIDTDLRRFLIEKNLVIYLGHPLTPSTRPRPCRELGIGEYFAWQLNACRVLIRDRLLSSMS